MNIVEINGSVQLQKVLQEYNRGKFPLRYSCYLESGTLNFRCDKANEQIK